MKKIRVHLKRQSFHGEERKPHPAAKCVKAKRKDTGAIQTIWVWDFSSNFKFSQFIENDKVCLMLPSKYEKIDFTLIIQDLENWDKILLYNLDF